MMLQHDEKLYRCAGDDGSGGGGDGDGLMVVVAMVIKVYNVLDLHWQHHHQSQAHQSAAQMFTAVSVTRMVLFISCAALPPNK